MSDAVAARLRTEALEAEKHNPEKAIALLREAVDCYPQEWTTINLIIDDLIRVASKNEQWTDAILAARKAQQLKNTCKESYAVTEKALRLQQQGRFVDAVDVHVEYAQKRGANHNELVHWANTYADLDENDKAWSLFNQAVASASKISKSPHTVYQQMAQFLLRKNRPNNAVEILIDAIEQAERLNRSGAPKSLTSDLKRALKAAGIEDSDAAYKIAADCTTNGSNEAKQLFYSLL